MRFTIVESNGKWLIIDNELGAVHSSFNNHAAAANKLNELNSAPPDRPNNNRSWSIQVVTMDKSESVILDMGYEPFAVENGRVYLKKKITAR